jgi:xanthine dehydrogenase YagT iron-sulfur-binding subunit
VWGWRWSRVLTALAVANRRIGTGLLVNGVHHELELDPRMTLLDCLREQLHLTGSKKAASSA